MKIDGDVRKPSIVKVGHIKARTQKPAIYPARLPVPEAKVPWSVRVISYPAPYFVAQVVLDNDGMKKPNGWADPENIDKVSHPFKSYEGDGEVNLDGFGRPLNPRGRTGMRGRGLLGKWGANFAADPLITRNNPETGGLEMLAIKRKDTGEWAIPGGMVDAGEVMSATAARELGEEAGVKLDMSDAVEIYRGYVDDPRNTDNAWMETTVMHKHLSAAEAALVKPIAGDDAADVRWLPLTEDNISRLYASHADFVREAVRRT